MYLLGFLIEGVFLDVPDILVWRYEVIGGTQAILALSFIYIAFQAPRADAATLYKQSSILVPIQFLLIWGGGLITSIYMQAGATQYCADRNDRPCRTAVFLSPWIWGILGVFSTGAVWFWWNTIQNPAKMMALRANNRV